MINTSNLKLQQHESNSEGFTIVEILVGITLAGFMIIATTQALRAVRDSYAATRQLNEVFSASTTFPELDRGLRYESLATSTDQTQTVTFQTEGQNIQTITYQPVVSVNDSSTLSETNSVSDSKVIDVAVPYKTISGASKTFQVRLLITRNGIGQQ